VNIVVLLLYAEEHDDGDIKTRVQNTSAMPLIPGTCCVHVDESAAIICYNCFLFFMFSTKTPLLFI
jgi:hypothetical protein